MTTGTWILLGAIAAALVLGLWRAWGDGRFSGTHRVEVGGEGDPGETDRTVGSVGSVGSAVPGVLAETALAGELGERATLLQFSSAFCAPCRATRRTLAEVAAAVPGVRHVEVDAEHHLDLVRRLGILRTPTTLVLDAHGREVSRASGAPRKEQVLAALGGAVS